MDLGLVASDNALVADVCAVVEGSRSSADFAFSGLDAMQAEGIVGLGKLHAFLEVVKTHYLSNPYHTWEHAVDVAHS